MAFAILQVQFFIMFNSIRLVRNSILLLVSCLSVFTIYGQNSTYMIIPKPSYLKAGTGSFLISPKTKIYYSKEALSVASFLGAFLQRPTGYSLSLSLMGTKNKKGVYLIIDPSFGDSTKGAYSLEIDQEKVIAKAADNTGLFYAVQSIRQLLPPSIESHLAVKNQEWLLPAMKITDAPRFEWRGYMQDVSRTFYGVNIIKNIWI
ncbi:beta-N-acetylhexosaminidase [Niabella ginsengisoli]|uniref:beta-N-acetylhexosaminidase n=1 Tax=Niabella ginsengisoli TaxID=522298 RepID=A0ABS9SIN4_9BACT|nr:beta-N-acetylhexosaminidase [Niabella ginsengisoli]MCH5598227.1 beta-N-acetylhexosaminidase [Niabella ginsengisoli]